MRRVLVHSRCVAHQSTSCAAVGMRVLSPVFLLPHALTSVCSVRRYMSPEQVSSTGHGFESDWWALGVLIYEMIYGEPPFGGEGKNETQVYAEISLFDGHLDFDAPNSTRAVPVQNYGALGEGM